MTFAETIETVSGRMAASFEAERRRRIKIIVGLGVGMAALIGATLYYGLKG